MILLGIALALGMIALLTAYICYRMAFHSEKRKPFDPQEFNLPEGDEYAEYRESIKGWIQAELFMDFHVTGENPVVQEIDEYIIFFNEQRPAYSLNYLTPKQYREAYTT